MPLVVSDSRASNIARVHHTYRSGKLQRATGQDYLMKWLDAVAVAAVWRR